LSTCLDGQKTCTVLNETLNDILFVGFGGESIVKGYVYSSEFVTNISSEIEKESIVKIEKGNCTGDFSSYTYPVSYSGGSIEITLKTC